VDSDPPFVIAVPDIEIEGVGRDIHKQGVLEPATQKMFQYILKDRCSKMDELVVDLGSNFGYFTTYTAVMGCRVIAVEAQPRLKDIVRTTFELNSVKDKVTYYTRIVSHDTNAKLKIKYKSTCWACSYVEGPPKPGETNGTDVYIIPSIKVDDIVQHDLILMKIDVEGFEVHALHGAWKLLTTYNVENLLIEWSPRTNTNAKITSEMAYEMLSSLMDLGYSIRHYNLRVSYPNKDQLQLEEFPIIGQTWKVSRAMLRDFSDFYWEKNKEANIWLTKG